MSAINNKQNQNNQPNKSSSDFKEIKLHSEQLAVERTQKKLGEVVVRKVVETTMIEVPVRREKLIIEEVGNSEIKQLAEIDLSENKATNIDQQKIAQAEEGYQAQGEFLTIATAREALRAIAAKQYHNPGTKVRIQLVVENPELQQSYQKILDSFSQ